MFGVNELKGLFQPSNSMILDYSYFHSWRAAHPPVHLATQVNGRCLYYVNWEIYLDLTLVFLFLVTHYFHSFPAGDTIYRSQKIRESYVGAYHYNFNIAG